MTSRKSRLSRIIVRGACGMLLPSALFAQVAASSRSTEATSARLRKECADAQVVAKKRGAVSDAATANAVRQLSRCEISGGAALSELWGSVSAPQTSADEVQTLLRASSDIRDGRLAMRLEGIAQDATKNLALRQAALVVLASYINPRLTGTLRRSGGPNGQWTVAVAHADHSQQTDSAEPIDSGQRARTLQLLRSIGQGRGAMADLAQYLLVETTDYKSKQ